MREFGKPFQQREDDRKRSLGHKFNAPIVTEPILRAKKQCLAAGVGRIVNGAELGAIVAEAILFRQSGDPGNHSFSQYDIRCY